MLVNQTWLFQTPTLLLLANTVPLSPKPVDSLHDFYIRVRSAIEYRSRYFLKSFRPAQAGLGLFMRTLLQHETWVEAAGFFPVNRVE